MFIYKMRHVTVVLIALFISIILSLLEKQISYLFLLIPAILILFNTSKDLKILLIIVLQITFTGGTLLEFRPLINSVSLLFLLYLFLSEYGFNIKDYPKIPRPILIFIIFISITILFSSIFSTNVSGSIVALIRFFIFFLFCYLIYAQIKNITSIRYLILSLFLSVLIIGLTMFFEFAEKGFSFFVENGALLRLAGIYENPNYVGMLLVLTIPFSLSYLLFDYNNKFRVFIAVALLFQMIILLLADSRSSFLSITISTLVLLFFSSKKIKIIFFSMAALTALVLILFTDINFLIELFLRPERIGTRDLFWQTGIEVIASNTWVGTGANTFEYIFYSFSPSELIMLINLGDNVKSPVSPHPHNLFVYFWAENGILGLMSIILFFITVFYMTVKIMQKPVFQAPANRPIIIVILSILFGVFVRSFFEITGVLTYGFITRDLPLWVMLIILFFFYEKFSNSIRQESID